MNIAERMQRLGEGCQYRLGPVAYREYWDYARENIQPDEYGIIEARFHGLPVIYDDTMPADAVVVV